MINDDALREFYNFEYEKIPVLFRFNKKRTIIVGSIAAFLALAAVVLFILLPYTIDRPGSEHGEIVVRYAWFPGMSEVFLGIIVVLAIVVGLLAIWIILSIMYEKKAYSRASYMASQSAMWKKEKIKDDYNQMKLRNPESFF